jgi:transcriptional regulator with XRE-family HTH domain
MPRKQTDPLDIEVGRKVRALRLERNMSQEKLGDALGLTFQQVQKYEKGVNRIGASRLQQIGHILQVPASFFFEGAPPVPGQKVSAKDAPSPAYVSDFLASSDGLALVAAFMKIKSAKLRHCIVTLTEEIAPEKR